ncbi:MAG TPA: hypothetical protein PLC07_07025 [Bacillota bacterium]|nr:hypothetical protein [Bacillota bacterium]HPT87033.1 hypothetical protein [Bacillota bacterium]
MEQRKNKDKTSPSIHGAYSKENIATEINLDPPEVNEFLLQTIPETTESEISVLKLEPNDGEHNPHPVTPDHPPKNHS